MSLNITCSRDSQYVKIVLARNKEVPYFTLIITHIEKDSPTLFLKDNTKIVILQPLFLFITPGR